MENNNNKAKQNESEDFKKLALHYMKTLVDVARESFLIVGADFRVISANPIFYETFQVSPGQTENKVIFDLGNGQWNIPELRKLLKEVLPYKKVVRNYEVRHTFETIGDRTMTLNARQIDAVQLIILAIEDITEKRNIESKLAGYTKELEAKVAERTQDLAYRVKELESLTKSMEGRELKMVELKKEIENLKRRVKNGNGKNGKRK